MAFVREKKNVLCKLLIDFMSACGLLVLCVCVSSSFFLQLMRKLSSFSVTGLTCFSSDGAKRLLVMRNDL